LTALHLSAKEGHVKIVQELLSNNADPNRTTNRGNTAMHIASLAGQVEVINQLLEVKAQVDVQAQGGFTPLYMAAQEKGKFIRL
jgi:ankyrin